MRDLLLRFNRSVLFIGHGRVDVPDVVSVHHAQNLGVDEYHGNIITLLQYRHPPGARFFFFFLWGVGGGGTALFFPAGKVYDVDILAKITLLRMNFVAFQIAVTSNPVPQTKAMAKTLKLQFFVTHGVTKKQNNLFAVLFF